MNTPRRTFNYNGATVKIEGATALSVFRRNRVTRILQRHTEGDDVRAEAALNFIYLHSQSSVDGTLGFDWSDANATEAEIIATFEGWLRLPERVITEWIEHVNAVDQPPGDPDLLPPHDLPDAKKKTPK